MAGISAHVLNITTGRPIGGMQVELYDLSTSPPTRLTNNVTNADGRTDKPMLAPADTKTGLYELRFHVNAHFKAPDALSDVVPIRFSIFDASQHYHVPMLCSPWFFSTYRGS
jgi:5-hydroxyisourate hydrolase